MAWTLRWWRIRQWLRRRGRLYLSLVLTMLVVAYVVVPWTVRFVESLSGYNPIYYEPHDPEREHHLKTHGAPEAFFGWETALKLALLVLVGLLWLSVAVAIPWWGPRSSRR